MDFGISTSCFGTAPLTLDKLEQLRKAGFRVIELHAAVPGLDYRDRAQIRDITRWFPGNELPPPSLHLPFEQSVLESGPRERQSALDAVKRCLELGDRLPLRYAVLHLGAAGSPFNPVHFEHAYTAISMIRAFSGLRVLLETLPNDIATFSRIAELQIAAQFPDVGICYDTGHGEMDGAPDVIHLNDNHGEGDEHLWPFDGSRDWPALVERLVVQSYDGLFILEGRDDRLERASSCRSRLQDLMDEARNSVEEFRLKYKLPIPQEEFE